MMTMTINCDIAPPEQESLPGLAAARGRVFQDDDAEVRELYRRIMRRVRIPAARPSSRGGLSWEVRFAPQGEDELKAAQEEVAGQQP